MASAIAKADTTSTDVTAPHADTDSLLRLIERAASDPAYDIDKMERLVRMYDQMKSRAQEQEFTVALRSAQEAMRPIVKDASNPQTRSKYASYGALDNAVRPIYTKEGFVVSFDTGENPPADHVRVIAIVSHIAGFSRQHHVDMPADGKGAKGGDVMTKTHAAGSAYSYGQRYLLKLIFNLATIDKADDDDGNAAGRDPISPEQVMALRTLIEQVGGKKKAALEKGLLTYKKVKRLEDIPSTEFDNAVAAVEAKRGKVA